MRRHGKQTWLLRGLAALLLAATFGYVPYHVYARSGLAHYLVLRGDLVKVKADNARLRAEIARLERDAEALRSDERAIERVARSDLKLVKPGDIVFELEQMP